MLQELILISLDIFGENRHNNGIRSELEELKKIISERESGK